MLSSEYQVNSLSLPNKSVWKNIALGKHHCILQSNANTVWAVGYSDFGQLSIPHTEIAEAGTLKQDDDLENEEMKENVKLDEKLIPEVSIPSDITKQFNRKVTKVSCGKYHTLYLTDDHKVFASGLYTRGRLGIGAGIMENIHTPIKVLTDVMNICCGKDYSLALSLSGAVYTWGSNKYGCLGNGEVKNNVWEPCLIDLVDIWYIAAGYNHCAAISTQGKLYMWGRNNKGQIETKLEEIVITPQTITNRAITKNRIIAIALGKSHTLALTQSLDVYAWGSNEIGQLGISVPPTNKQFFTPTLIRSLVGKGVIKIACGSNHSCVVTLSGLLYTWGGNNNGQLGNSLEYKYQHIPIAVSVLAEQCIINVAAGYDYTIAISDTEMDIEKFQRNFELWRTSDEDIRSSKNSMRTEFKKSLPKRRKRDLDGPILVTTKEKVFGFKRARGNKVHVTVFADKDTGNCSEAEVKTRELYEKFWLQSHSPFKVKDKGKIFFGDKNQFIE